METLCSNRKGEFKSPSYPGLDILVLPTAEPRKLRSTSMQMPQRQSSIPELHRSSMRTGLLMIISGSIDLIECRD
jgi:hypothetical protein